MERKNGFHLPENPSCQLSLARISPFFENCELLIPIMVSTSSNIPLTKKILFPLRGKSVSTSRVKDIEK